VTTIPQRLATVPDLVATVCADLDAVTNFENHASGRWLRPVRSGWHEPIGQVIFVLGADPDVLAVYVIVALPGGSDRDQLAHAVTRANFGSLPGCFELNIDDGELRYRGEMLLYGSPSASDVAQLLADALATVANYAPVFTAVGAGLEDPEEAMARIAHD
jgi:hypothetical protein